MDIFWLKTNKTIVSTIKVSHQATNKQVGLSICLDESGMFPHGQKVPLETLAPRVTLLSYEGTDYYYSPGTERVFDYNTLVTQNPESRSHQTWLITKPLDTSGNFVYPFTLREPIDVHKVTYSSKIFSYAMPYFNEVPVGFFNVPSPSTPFDNCYVMVAASQLILSGDELNVIEYDREAMTDKDVMDLRLSRFPLVEFETHEELTPFNVVNLGVSLVDYKGSLLDEDVELFFENINGQISHNRKIAVGGKTTIKVSAPMLDPGDSVRIKVGAKYFSGINDIILEVKSE